MILAIAVVGLIAVYLFLVFPAVRRHPDRKKLDGMMIAHRGLHNAEKGIPENSIAAFTEAAARGIAIELDIHLTADERVVVFHDKDLKRICRAEGKISEMTLAELKNHRLCDTNERIPSLKEVLSVVGGRVPLLIELKAEPSTCKRLCAKAEEILREYKGEYFIESFYPGVLSWYRKNRKDICRGQLATVYKGKSLLIGLVSTFVANFLARPDFVAYQNSGSKKLAFRLQKRLGAFPVGWTFKSEESVNSHLKDFKAFIFEGFIPETKSE